MKNLVESKIGRCIEHKVQILKAAKTVQVADTTRTQYAKHPESYFRFCVVYVIHKDCKLGILFFGYCCCICNDKRSKSTGS